MKMMKLFLWRIGKRKWFLPGVPEITADGLVERLNSNQPPLLIDLRSKKEFDGSGHDKYEKHGHIQGAKWIPFMELPSHLEELPRDREIVTICPGGGASLVAAEVMIDAGFKNVKSLKGGIWAWDKKGYPFVKEDSKLGTSEDRVKIIEGKQPLDKKYPGEIHCTLDVRDFSCPVPVLKSKKTLMTLKMGQVLEILTTDPGSLRDIPAWAHVTGQELLISEERGSQGFRFLVRRMK